MGNIILTKNKPDEFVDLHHNIIWCNNFKRHTKFTIGGYIVEFKDKNGKFLFRTKINLNWSRRHSKPRTLLINLAINKYVYHTYGAPIASMGTAKELREKLRSDEYVKTIYINYDGKWTKNGYLLPNKYEGQGKKTFTLDENVWNPNDFKDNVYIVKFE